MTSMNDMTTPGDPSVLMIYNILLSLFDILMVVMPYLPGLPPVPSVKVAQAKVVPVEDEDVGTNCCQICLEEYKDGDSLVLLPCRHRYHRDCGTMWLEVHFRCPFRCCGWVSPPVEADPTDHPHLEGEFEQEEEGNEADSPS